MRRMTRDVLDRNRRKKEKVMKMKKKTDAETETETVVERMEWNGWMGNDGSCSRKKKSIC